MRKKGFTLIELLVVIAIIALLLSILMPSLRKAKGLARDVVCRSNLKQWGLIWQMYCNNYDGLFPSNQRETQGPRGEWVISLRKEWKSRDKILVCPSATKITTETFGKLNTTYEMPEMRTITTSGEDTDPEFCSYGMNVWAYSRGENFNGQNGQLPEAMYWNKIQVSGDKGNIPLFMDSMWRGIAPDHTNGDGVDMPSDIQGKVWEGERPGNQYMNGISNVAMPRHSNSAKAGINVLFFDLTARHIGIKELWKLKWNRRFDTHIGYENSVTTNPEYMIRYEDH